MFPVFLNLTDRLAVVVGGGPVGRRKAEALLAAGAKVRLVCLESRPVDVHTALQWRIGEYQPEDLAGASLVFAAGPEGLNSQVVSDARALGVWVCSASAPEAGDFITPARIQRGDLVIAISTGGIAPALARRIRERLEEQFDDSFAVWLELLAEVRPMIQTRLADESRRALFEELTAWYWLDRLNQEGFEAVRKAMRELISTGD
jgi:precorrin-2 dehydrogenase/sirohydrochlorin ferrochelatase